jgi:hypothetical protein
MNAHDMMQALIDAAPEESVPVEVDKFRVGSLWRSKRTMRLRLVVEVRGDSVMTRFENGANYYWVTKDFLERLYYPIG